MKIVLIHYHLKSGGVTTVIRHQVEAIQSMGCEPLVLSGEPLDVDFPCDVGIVPGLAYDRLLPTDLTPEDVAEEIIAVVGRKWPRGADLLHVHNPTLGKNRLLQSVLGLLQRQGLNILCQIHDFAEDGRPDACNPEPYLADCHYAAINPRDHRLLLNTGLDTAGCHLLPNAVPVVPAAEVHASEQNGALYPVRAIRRKNIGEAILLALLLDGLGPLRITLPPNSPKDVAGYEFWKEFVRRHDLAVIFDAGKGNDFGVLMANCRFVVTTSITEGFGFTFLEPWTFGKALWGRLLPDICSGFIDHGVRFNWLYSRLWVPLAWFDQQLLHSKWTSALAAARRRLNQPVSPNDIETAWRAVSRDHCIDMGLLDEDFQSVAIEKILGSDAHRQQLTALNPALEKSGPPDDRAAVVRANAAAIQRHYGPVAYAARLEKIYHSVTCRPMRHRIDKGVLANAFLAPDQFSLLKWGER